MKASQWARRQRQEDWDRIGPGPFDAVVVGGGISGVSVYAALRRRGCRTLLLERGDFAGGTSQASAMMAWGGLLYLSSLDFSNVLRLSRSREELIRDAGAWVEPRTFRLACCRDSRRRSWMVQSALYLYWLMGGLRRSRPRRLSRGGLPDFVDARSISACFDYQEAVVRPSDARFVLDAVLARPSTQRGGCAALNYCSLQRGDFEDSAGIWHLGLQDRVLGRQVSVRTRQVVCAAGVWTDHINRRFGLVTPYRHVLSKGVFLGLPLAPQPGTPPLIFDTGRNADTLALIPWGPLALWGPTETVVTDPSEGFTVTPSDVDFLLQRLNRVLANPLARQEVVSVRCGVRPLAVSVSQPTPSTTLGCSKRFRIHNHRERHWISVYGGKFTSALEMGRQVADMIEGGEPGVAPQRAAARTPKPATIRFPGLEEAFPSPLWCLRRERCLTLDDYLRRRTNIAQWLPRGGLGRNNENFDLLVQLAGAFCDGDRREARRAALAYQQRTDQSLGCLAESPQHSSASKQEPL